MIISKKDKRKKVNKKIKKKEKIKAIKAPIFNKITRK